MGVTAAIVLMVRRLALSEFEPLVCLTWPTHSGGVVDIIRRFNEDWAPFALSPAQSISSRTNGTLKLALSMVNLDRQQASEQK